jgi:hypothetical protein
MSAKLKGDVTRADYAILRMDLAQKRMWDCTSEQDWERAFKWATAWGMAARFRYPSTCIRKRTCRYRTDECP